MKLLYDHSIFSDQKYGGISRYFFEIISRASKDPSFQVSLFHGLYINRYGLERYRDQFENYFGYPRPAIGKTTRIFKSINKFLFQSFFEKAAPQIYHQTNYADLVSGFTGKRVLTVLDMIHELYPELFPANDPTREQKKQAVAKADRILCISHQTKNDLVKLLGVPENKITVTHLSNSIVPEKNPPRLHTNPYILVVGDRKGYKNFEGFLKIYASSNFLKNGYDLVCGGGPDFSQNELEFMSKQGITEKIKWFPADDAVLSRLYTHAVCFVYPSLYEGFGIPVLEAMTHACPVFASNRGSIPELTGDAGVLFDPDNFEEFRTALEKNLGDSSALRKMRELSTQQAQKFSWEKCYEQTREVYLEA